MTRERPVTAREFRAVLTRIGFVKRPNKSTSHEQWVRDDGRTFFKVTLDPHNEPYHRKMLSYMLGQAGLSKREFFDLLSRL